MHEPLLTRMMEDNRWERSSTAWRKLRQWDIVMYTEITQRFESPINFFENGTLNSRPRILDLLDRIKKPLWEDRDNVEDLGYPDCCKREDNKKHRRLLSTLQKLQLLSGRLVTTIGAYWHNLRKIQLPDEATVGERKVRWCLQKQFVTYSMHHV